MFSEGYLRKLIIPLMIEQALRLTVGTLDIIMVASAGERAVSGVSLVDVINVLVIFLFTALAAGGAIVAGQYLGARDRGNSLHAAKQLVAVTFFVSVFIMAVCLLLNRQILSFFFGNVEEDVMESARIYFYLTALSYPFIAMFNSAGALFRGMGDSKTAMINALIMNGLNIGMNALFIYVMGLGVFGAALATLISRIAAASSMMWMLKNPNLEIFVRSYSLRDTDFLMIKRILRIGIPQCLESCIYQVGRIIMAGLVAVFGTASIAAHAVGTSLTGLEIIPGYALGLAITAVVAQCVGAREYGQAEYYTRYLVKKSYVWMAVLNLSILIIIKPILNLYGLSAETFSMSLQIMLVHGIASMVIWPVSFTLPSAFRAAGDVKYPMYVAIFSMFAFRVGFSFIFAYTLNLGVLSVWLAMVVDWVFRSICFVSRWHSGKWKNEFAA
jgi:putative MATE family efflux protein